MDSSARKILGLRKYNLLKINWFLPKWLFQYNDEMTIVAAIESAYLTWNP